MLELQSFSDLRLPIEKWVEFVLIPMAQHVYWKEGVGCSIEKWITPSLGHFLSKELSIDSHRIQYERDYQTQKGKCDLVVDNIWIEIKHIWCTTQSKQREELIKDVHRVGNVKNGQLIIFELATRPWYANWKQRTVHPNTSYFLANHLRSEPSAQVGLGISLNTTTQN